MTEVPRNPDLFQQLDERSREVFRRVVESYLETGEPIGSRSLTRQMTQKVSAATIRNAMQDLEYLGLIDSPHISAGRVPTEIGLRMFVDGFLEVHELDQSDRATIDASLSNNDADTSALLDRVGSALSGVTHGASLVLTPKREAPIRHIEFTPLAEGRGLAVLVFADGNVENRLFQPPPGITHSAMREAANFVNALAGGRTLSELRGVMAEEIAQRRRELDSRASALVESGVAIWEHEGEAHERLVVRGRANLLERGISEQEMERIRDLFDDLERKRDIVEFLELTEEGEGVRIFIGSENRLFSLTGSSLVVSPYIRSDRKIVGAVGVIGPTRLNYGRIVPIVDYTAQLVGKLYADRSKG